MWELDHKEDWTLKNRCFGLWCGRRLLRVPWTARRSSQSILKETSPEYSLEGLILKPKLQYFGHLMWRTDSFEKALMLGTIEGERRRGWQRMRWMATPTQWTWVWASSRRWWRTGNPGMLQSMGSQRVRHNWAAEQQQQWIRICLPMQQTQVPSLIWEDPTYHRASKSREPQLLKPVCLEPVLHSKRRPCTSVKSSPHSLQPEKACTATETQCN